MPLPGVVRDALLAAGAPVEEDVPLARKVWWRVGGPADGWCEVDGLDRLQAVRRIAHAYDLPVVVLGNGSNLLVADAGVRGLVVRLTGDLADVEEEGGLLHCGGGMRNNVLLARAGKHRWSGLDPLAGIPGTVGGAVRMNAGSALGEICDVLVDADVVTVEGEVVRLTRDDLRMSYRSTHLPPGGIVAFARLKPTDVPHEESEARIRAFLDRRKATQPLDMPSCGSTFRNPPGDTAGRLIDAAGLKGHRIGGAEVSEKHANFLLNTGDATAADIRALIHHVRATVRERFGVDLHPEVEIIGTW